MLKFWLKKWYSPPYVGVCQCFPVCERESHLLTYVHMICGECVCVCVAVFSVLAALVQTAGVVCGLCAADIGCDLPDL